jgi:type IV pilus assembly protein PilA
MLTRLRHRAQGQEGFTLIELLVVILIIGILAAIAIPAFLNQKGKAQDANAKSDINSAQTAEESYITNSGVTAYTATSGDLTTIEPTLSDAFTKNHLSVTNATASGYTISEASSSGVTFTLTKTNGTISRTCNVPSGTNPAGCTLSSGTSGDGTW